MLLNMYIYKSKLIYLYIVIYFLSIQVIYSFKIYTFIALGSC